MQTIITTVLKNLFQLSKKRSKVLFYFPTLTPQTHRIRTANDTLNANCKG